MCLVLNTERWDLRVSPAGREGGESYWYCHPGDWSLEPLIWAQLPTWLPMWVRKCVVDGEHRATANNPQYSEHILRDSPELRLWLRCLRWRLGITRDNYSDQDNTQHNPRKTRDSHALSVYPSCPFPQHTRKYKPLINTPEVLSELFLFSMYLPFMYISSTHTEV